MQFSTNVDQSGPQCENRRSCEGAKSHMRFQYLSF